MDFNKSYEGKRHVSCLVSPIVSSYSTLTLTATDLFNAPVV